MAFNNIPRTEFDRFNRLLTSYYDRKTIIRVNDCEEWKGYVEKNGYGRICLTLNQKDGPTVSVRVFVHRFAFLCHNNSFNMHDNDDFELTVSHLCGRKTCVKREHLYLEPLDVNKSRIKCHKDKVCTGHNPKCLII